MRTAATRVGDLRFGRAVPGSKWGEGHADGAAGPGPNLRAAGVSFGVIVDVVAPDSHVRDVHAGAAGIGNRHILRRALGTNFLRAEIQLRGREAYHRARAAQLDHLRF